MARGRNASETLGVLERLLARAQAEAPARRAAFDATLAALRAAGPHERGRILEELAATRAYRSGGHATFRAFLASEGIPRTTAHRLRIASRLRPPDEVERRGVTEAYLRARESIERGEVLDGAAIVRRASGWLRREGIRLPAVSIVPAGHRFLVRMEVDVREMKRVLERKRR